MLLGVTCTRIRSSKLKILVRDTNLFISCIKQASCSDIAVVSIGGGRGITNAIRLIDGGVNLGPSATVCCSLVGLIECSESENRLHRCMEKAVTSDEGMEFHNRMRANCTDELSR